MPYMDSETKEELREKTEVLKEKDDEAVYHIPKEYTEEFFTYGKPQDAISRMLGSELAKQAWNIDEEEAVEQGVNTESIDAGGNWAVRVSR